MKSNVFDSICEWSRFVFCFRPPTYPRDGHRVRCLWRPLAILHAHVRSLMVVGLACFLRLTSRTITRTSLLAYSGYSLQQRAIYVRKPRTNVCQFYPIDSRSCENFLLVCGHDDRRSGRNEASPGLPRPVIIKLLLNEPSILCRILIKDITFLFGGC